MTMFHSSSAYSSGCLRMLVPALFTRISSRPNFFTAALISARHDSAEVTSTATASALAPGADDRGTRFGEALRHAEADAPVAAGDDRDPSAKIEKCHLASSVRPNCPEPRAWRAVLPAWREIRSRR